MSIQPRLLVLTNKKIKIYVALSILRTDPTGSSKRCISSTDPDDSLVVMRLAGGYQ